MSEFKRCGLCLLGSSSAFQFALFKFWLHKITLRFLGARNLIGRQNLDERIEESFRQLVKHFEDYNITVHPKNVKAKVSVSFLVTILFRMVRMWKIRDFGWRSKSEEKCVLQVGQEKLICMHMERHK